MNNHEKYMNESEVEVHYWCHKGWANGNTNINQSVER